MVNGIDVHINNIIVMIKEQNFPEALNYIENLNDKEKQTWEIQNLLGVICSYCGEFEQAITFFRRSLNKNPDCLDIYFNLADAYFNIEDYNNSELMLKFCEYIANDDETITQIHEMRSKFKDYTDSDDKKHNVLMIAYYFPPLSGSGVFRSLKFAKYLPEYNWHPTVISTDIAPNGWNFMDETLKQEIPDDIKVIRIPDYISTGRETQINVEQTIVFLKNVFQQDKKAMNIFQKLISSEQGIKSLMLFPCSCLIWSIEVIKYIEENIDLNNINVIYTTSGPYSSHLVGLYFKMKDNIPWVADYRDPWASNPYASYDYSNPIHYLLLRLENILLHQADYNITISDCFIEDYKNKFNLKDDRIKSITNGYDEFDFIHLNYNKGKNIKFIINYSGLLYTSQRNISPILMAIKQLINENKIDMNSIIFRVVGEGNEEQNRNIVEKYGLYEIFEQTGYVSHAEALQSNIDSDLLLLLIGDEDRFKSVFTGKVFDYLRSGKPILAIAPKNGVVDELLSITDHGKTFISTQIEEIKNMIYQEYKTWLNNNENSYIHSPLIKLYERKYLTLKLVDIFHNIKK